MALATVTASTFPTVLTTVWGQGTVNVNSAPPLTLVALVSAGAPTAGICTDPAQTSASVSA